jgi:hypothetical protein
MSSFLQSISEMLRIILPKLFEAPFLGFLGFILFLLWFRRELRLLFGRGDILLSWGERSIRLRELSKSLDEELEPIRDDIETLRKSIELTDKKDTVEKALTPSPANEDAEHARSRIRAALASSEYKWRSIDRLAAISGLPESRVLELIRGDPFVRLSVGKSGRRIVGLTSRVGI